MYVVHWFLSANAIACMLYGLRCPALSADVRRCPTISGPLVYVVSGRTGSGVCGNAFGARLDIHFHSEVLGITVAVRVTGTLS